MDVVGSEIGQKMRSAIKAKLTELGCYVDDELPDYVMVMVANKRTRAQMEDDLQLFLGDNTELFVNWLHQVLKKLQEVTVTTPLTIVEPEKSKEKETSTSKEQKAKEKKTKEKVKGDLKKAKKKGKIKLHRKKDEKKTHKSKKKSKHHEIIRPNIPPLLMNMEKNSEPSITDVFAGQILKNHGITLGINKDDLIKDTKPIIKEIKRPILPIIDPATILSEPELTAENTEFSQDDTNQEAVLITDDVRVEQIDEINKIEAKIQGLKQKLVEQLDSMSDDEDFLNIRTEAEELMNDFAEDVFQEISEQAPVISTPPLQKPPTPPPPPPVPKPIEVSKSTAAPIEILPHIELKLPKRPVRERLGVRDTLKKVVPVKAKDATRTKSPERFTPDREPVFRTQTKSAKSRLGDLPETQKKPSVSDDGIPEKSDSTAKRLTSRVSVLESRPPRSACASVVRVRPRPRVSAPASNLLLKAVAEAHKSLLNIPPKVDTDPQKVKRALVLPMRRNMDAHKIVIQVPGGDNSQETGDSISLGDMDSDDDKSSKLASETDKEEYIPASITKKIINNQYTPSSRHEGRTSSRKNDTFIIETINIHNPSVNRDKNTQFIVTMDGFSPNAFLAKKLLTEGLLNEDDEQKPDTPTVKPKPKDFAEKSKNTEIEQPENLQKKRLSNTSEESNTQVIIMKDIDFKNDKRKIVEERIEKRKITEESNVKRKNTEDSIVQRKSVDEIIDKRTSAEGVDGERTSVEDGIEKRKSIELSVKDDAPPAKKRKGSPIVFDVGNKEKEVDRVRQRTESASSDSHVTVTTVTNTHKYDSVPPLSAAERKQVWCRSFPLCRYGSACAFAHPRCKFAASCTRRGCVYAHAHTPHAPPAVLPHAPILASHVVPAANYKTISATVPNICKFYPSCVNPLCHFYHPKPCRYGQACGNKLECNFYHADAPHAKWRYPV